MSRELVIMDERAMLDVGSAEVMEACTRDWETAIKDWVDPPGILVAVIDGKPQVIASCEYLVSIPYKDRRRLVRGALK